MSLSSDESITYDIWRVFNDNTNIKYSLIGTYQTNNLSEKYCDIYINNISKADIKNVYDKLFIIPSNMNIYDSHCELYEYCDLTKKFSEKTFCCIF